MRLAHTALLCALLVASGGCDLIDKIKSPSGPTPDSSSPAPPAASAPVRYTAIGASDATGVGASVLCIPLTPCENGTGYVPVLARRLRAASHEVTLTNLG